MSKRATNGRALFYTRDSGGQHETTPGEYVLWAQRKSAELEVSFNGTPQQIHDMIQGGLAHEGDLYVDFGVKGNQLSRAGLDALIKRVLTDHDVTHVFVPRRDRLARPDDANDAVQLENLLRKSGITLVFMDLILPPLAKGSRRDVVEQIVALLAYNSAGEFRRELAQKIIYAQLALAKAGFSVGGRPPYGFRRWLVHQDGTPVHQLQEAEYVKRPGHHVVWLPGPEE